MAVSAEIISVGTELLLGHVTNTDTRDVAEALSNIGINVFYQSVVGDNASRLKDVVEIAKGRADIIITTGGLGPTVDDITKKILCESFGVELVTDENEVKALHDYITGRREITNNNYSQTLVPKGGTVFHNTCGTAPGCAFEKDGKIVAMLPGPPKECRAMLSLSLIPYLKSISNDIIVSHSVHVFGIGESRVDDMFASVMNEMTNPSMAPYAKECDCLVQITAKADSVEKGEEMCAPVIEMVKNRIGDLVYGLDVDNIETAVFQLLEDKTFAIAESFTGGAVAKRFSDLEGSERNFKGGMINLSFPGGEEAAAKLAESIRVNFNADFGLSVVTKDDKAYTALATADETMVRISLMKSTTRSRSFIHQMAGNHAYDMLRRYLTGLDVIADL